LTATVSRFDRRASTYEDGVLQQFLFGPVHQTTLQLALQHRPQAQRVLDVGCGTGQLLRCARPHYPTANLVGVDLSQQMLATASTITPARLSLSLTRARAEQLPFPDEVFDIVFTTLSLRHWTDLPAGITEIGRVLGAGGVLVLADIFPICRHSTTADRMPRRHPSEVPAELASLLAAQRLAVVGCARTRWFRLPDVQVIAARSMTRRSGRCRTQVN
jgi:ubiquinone/menaquinone biosynthesis C-methylase UbiE